MKINTKLLLVIWSFGLYGFNTCHAQAVAVPNIINHDLIKVIVKAEHFITADKKVKVRYVFSVVNNSISKIYRVTVGEKSLTNSDPSIVSENMDARNSSIFSPKLWEGEVVRDESPELLFAWKVKESLQSDRAAVLAAAMPAQSTWDSFVVEVPRSYPTLYQSYATIDSNLTQPHSSQIFKYDSVAPKGTIVSSVLPHYAGNGLHQINIDIKATDNYDQLPKVIFDSIKDITSSNTGVPLPSFMNLLLTANQIAQTAQKKNLYSFTLPSDPKKDKKYRISYKIIDASDNQSIVSTVVTIPKRR